MFTTKSIVESGINNNAQNSVYSHQPPGRGMARLQEPVLGFLVLTRKAKLLYPVHGLSR